MKVTSTFFALSLLAFVTIGESAMSLSSEKESFDTSTTVLITCTVAGGDTFNGWFSPNGNVSDQKSQRVHFEREGDRFKLHIQNISVSDGGSYECRAENNGPRQSFLLWVRHVVVPSTAFLQLDKTQRIITDIEGFPTPIITWKKKFGQKEVVLKSSVPGVSGQPRYVILPKGSLQINRVTENDTGIYVCDVTQGAWHKPFEIDVKVYRDPEIIQGPVPLRRYVTQGQNTSFTCIVGGFPPPKIEWFNPVGQPVSTFDPRKIIDGNTFRLLNVEKSDKGNWTCRITVAQGITKNASSEIVDVYVQPVITEPLFPWVYFPELYKDYTITCKAKGYPLPTVIIRKNGAISSRMKMGFRDDYGYASIKFYLVREHDLGNYSCETWGPARNSSGYTIVVNQTFAIFTKDRPVVNPDGSPKIIYSYVGNPKPIRINCDFFCYPTCNVTVWRGFYELTNGTSQATLYVWTYSWEDFGHYSCIASNIYGEVNVTVSIQHATPPSKPTNVQINVTCDRAYFSWTPPNNTGGMEIERYQIEDLRSPLLKRNTNDSYPLYRMWHLEPNREYTVAIRAMNRQGPGEPATVIFRTNASCLPYRPEVFAPVEYILDRNFMDLRWMPPSNADEWEGLWYRILVKEKDDISNIGASKLYSSLEPVQRIGGLPRNKTIRIMLWAMTEDDQYSQPTYVHYFVSPFAWGSAHAIAASMWSVLLAVLVSWSMRS